jgi:hypothetical protein
MNDKVFALPYCLSRESDTEMLKMATIRTAWGQYCLGEIKRLDYETCFLENYPDEQNIGIPI